MNAEGDGLVSLRGGNAVIREYVEGGGVGRWFSEGVYVWEGSDNGVFS